MAKDTMQVAASEATSVREVRTDAETVSRVRGVDLRMKRVSSSWRRRLVVPRIAVAVALRHRGPLEIDHHPVVAVAVAVGVVPTKRGRTRTVLIFVGILRR